MSEKLLEEFQEDYALLIEAGFIAVKQLDETSARRLFEAAEMLRPDNPAARIGLGYIALNKLEVKKATEIFEEVIKEDPDHHLAQTFLGMCFLLKKATRQKGVELIKDAEGKTDDSTVKNLCELALKWSEKDLSKKKSPFFPETPQKEE